MADECALFPYSPECDHLAETHAEEFERLRRAILSGGGFRLLLAQYNLPYYRDGIIDRLRHLVPRSRVFHVDREEPEDFAALQARMSELSEKAEVLHVSGLANWRAVPEKSWLKSMNHRRESLARQCPIAMVLWLSGRLVRELALQAPDMWAWRGGVFDFSVRADIESPLPPKLDSTFLSRPERQRRRARIDELESYLASSPDISAGLRASLLNEQGEIYVTLGEPGTAMACFEKALHIFSSLGDETNKAETMGKIADILQERGELDEALRIRREEELPVYERLGDVRSRAVAMGRIADIYEARGELDEALRIRREESLPVYERLGDVRSRAVAMGRIADIYEARGELDEALRIRREEELPVYERLGDVRSRAVAMGRIADIYEARGELDEALRIRREEELPVYERLGDVRSRAVAMGRIADIHQARGELDEALRIRREEELPVYERLGDVRSRAVAMGRIADIYEARGELDEALRIRREEELPVYERLGDVRGLLVARAKIAILYLQMEPPLTEEANRLLCQALAAARSMKIPEADTILAILEKNGMKCEED